MKLTDFKEKDIIRWERPREYRAIAIVSSVDASTGVVKLHILHDSVFENNYYKFDIGAFCELLSSDFKECFLISKENERQV